MPSNFSAVVFSHLLNILDAEQNRGINEKKLLRTLLFYIAGFSSKNYVSAESNMKTFSINHLKSFHLWFSNVDKKDVTLQERKPKSANKKRLARPKRDCLLFKQRKANFTSVLNI